MTNVQRTSAACRTRVSICVYTAAIGIANLNESRRSRGGASRPAIAYPLYAHANKAALALDVVKAVQTELAEAPDTGSAAPMPITEVLSFETSSMSTTPRCPGARRSHLCRPGNDRVRFAKMRKISFRPFGGSFHEGHEAAICSRFGGGQGMLREICFSRATGVGLGQVTTRLSRLFP
jgi:hypothetical protein